MPTAMFERFPGPLRAAAVSDRSSRAPLEVEEEEECFERP